MGSGIKSVIAYLFVLRLLRLGISLITVTFTAKYYGVSIEKDIWLLVSTLIATICSACWGPFNETFRSQFIFIKEGESERMANRAAANLITTITFVSILICAIIYVARMPLADFFAIDFPEKGKELFEILLLIMLPSFLLTELPSIGISVLNAYNIFYLPEIVGFFSGLSNLAIIVCLAPKIGIYALAISQYVGCILLSLAIIIYIIKLKKFTFTDFVTIKWIYIRPFVFYALPFFVPYFLGQLNAMSEKWLAGLLGPGNVSSLDYSRQFTVILQGVIGSVLTSVLVPILATHKMKSETIEFSKSLKDCIGIIFMILLLAIPLLFGGAYPLCTILYHRGAVTMENIALISNLCRCFSFSFIGVVTYLIFGCFMLSVGEGKKYALIGAMCQIGVIVANVLLYSVLDLYIFPLSLGVMHFIAGFVMWYKVRDTADCSMRHILYYSLIIIVLSIAVLGLFNTLDIQNTWISLMIISGAIVLMSLPLSYLLGVDLKRLAYERIFRSTRRKS